MSHINDNFGVAALPLSLAVAGPIATAANSVDKASGFAVTATAAGLALTLPTPTKGDMQHRVLVTNALANVNSYTVNGYKINAGESGYFAWDGATWITEAGGRNMGASISVAAIAAGNFTVAHNLALPTGTFSNVVFRAFDSTGSEIIFKRNKTADTANVIGFYSPSAITAGLPIVFDIVPLA
jgi:hypothetical protein